MSFHRSSVISSKIFSQKGVLFTVFSLDISSSQEIYCRCHCVIFILLLYSETASLMTQKQNDESVKTFTSANKIRIMILTHFRDEVLYTVAV